MSVKAMSEMSTSRPVTPGETPSSVRMSPNTIQG